jgi:hypothetical protein
MVTIATEVICPESIDGDQHHVREPLPAVVWSASRGGSARARRNLSCLLEPSIGQQEDRGHEGEGKGQLARSESWLDAIRTLGFSAQGRYEKRARNNDGRGNEGDSFRARNVANQVERDVK